MRDTFFGLGGMHAIFKNMRMARLLGPLLAFSHSFPMLLDPFLSPFLLFLKGSLSRPQEKIK